ncbi:hypothetical protein QJS66_21480 [Kocuria rhizophila]|nr:hypothetical protein QJS66_21480 [Kocuria rhizophila]
MVIPIVRVSRRRVDGGAPAIYFATVVLIYDFALGVAIALGFDLVSGVAVESGQRAAQRFS